VEDTALFLDAVGDGGESLAEAARRPPARLKVGVSFDVPPPVRATVDEEQRGAVMRLVEALRAAGHTVLETLVPYRTSASAAAAARYLRGIHDAVAMVDRPERLARRTRGYVRLGGLVPPPVMRRVRAAEARHRDELLRAFKGGVDLVVTPMFTRRPVPVGEWEGRGALRTFDGTTRWVPFCALWNHTGQPATALPAGRAPDGFPLSAQLVGRPGQDALLLAVAAQLQDVLGWPAERPPVS
jgi:amidase